MTRLLLILLAIVCFLQAPAASTRSERDRPKPEVQALLDKASRFSRRNADSILTYADVAYVRALELTDTVGQIDALTWMATALERKGSYERALEKLTRARQLAAQSRRIEMEGYLLLELGNNARMRGLIESALDHYFDALALEGDVAENAWTEIYAKVNHRLGQLFYRSKQYKTAVKHHEASLVANRARNHDLAISVNLFSLANAYWSMEAYEEARTRVDEAAALKAKHKDSLGLGRTLMLSGLIYQSQDVFDSARIEFDRSRDMFNRIGARGEIALVDINYGYGLLKEARYAEALQYFDPPFIRESDPATDVDALVARYRARALYGVGRYREAYEMMKLHVQVIDSIREQETTMKIVQKQADIELAKQGEEMEALAAESAKKTTQLEVRTAWLWALLAIVGAVLALSLVLYYRYRLKRRATAELDALNQLRSRFFANISHEFRTPLSLILGPLEEVLEQLPGDDPLRHRLELTQRNAHRLHQLNDQLLELARLEGNALQLRNENGDLGAFVRGVAEAFRPLADQRGLKLTVIVPEPPLYLRFDPDRLGKILNNLLSNAFKYARTRVRIRLDAAAARPMCDVIIYVADDGPGVPEADRKRIFERFYQVQPRDGSGGAGIGLALVRELTALFGGKISVAQSKEGGAMFRLDLRLEEGDEDTQQVLTPPSPAETVSVIAGGEVADNPDAPILLIVEDHAELRQFVADAFAADYGILTAENGQAGLSLAQAHLPDLIITDRMMPELDGLALCKALKSDHRTSHIPVIMLTALSAETDKLEGLESGADAYLGKPFGLRELRLQVRNLVQARSGLREEYAQALAPEPTAVTVNSMDAEFLEKAIRLVEEQIDNPALSAEALSQDMGLSRVHLYRKLKALTGQSVSEFIRGIRLKRAASLISQGYGNVSDVVYAVGFSNPSYFSKCFKETFGVTPSQYAAEQQK